MNQLRQLATRLLEMVRGFRAANTQLFNLIAAALGLSVKSRW
jgi:hypothetical protein